MGGGTGGGRGMDVCRRWGGVGGTYVGGGGGGRDVCGGGGR